MKIKRLTQTIAILWISLMPFFLGGCSMVSSKFVAENGSAKIQITTPAINLFSSDLKLATKNYVASTLRQIFGDGSSHPLQDQIISKLIDAKYGSFGGGPCDPYAHTGCGLSSVPGLSTMGEAALPQVPAIATARMALTVRACDKLAATDDAIYFAVGLIQATGVTGSTAAKTPPTDKQITQLYELFHPGATPSSTTAMDLSNIATKASLYGAMEAWRFVLLTLCLSPSWQVV